LLNFLICALFFVQAIDFEDNDYLTDEKAFTGRFNKLLIDRKKPIFL